MNTIKKIFSLILICLIFLTCTACKKNNHNDSNSNTIIEIDSDNDTILKEELDTEKDSQSKITYESVEMSDDIYDFTVKIDGFTYKLPAQLSDFKTSGWSYMYDKNPEDRKIYGESEYFASIENKNGDITIGAINMSGNTKKFGECKIGVISYSLSESNNCNIELSKGLVLIYGRTTLQDVINKWGEPTEKYDNRIIYRKSRKIEYEFGSTDGTVIKWGYIKNYVSDKNDNTTNSQRPLYLNEYETPNSLTNDLFSYTFRLEGDLYTLPTPVSEFIKNGWIITDKAEKVAGQQGIAAGLQMRKNGKTLTFTVRNFSDLQVSVEDSMITAFNWDSIYGELDLELSGNIKFGMKEEEFLKNVKSSEFNRYVNENTGAIDYNFTSYTHHAYFYFTADGILRGINFGKEILE